MDMHSAEHLVLRLVVLRVVGLDEKMVDKSVCAMDGQLVERLVEL